MNRLSLLRAADCYHLCPYTGYPDKAESPIFVLVRVLCFRRQFLFKK